MIFGKGRQLTNQSLSLALKVSANRGGEPGHAQEIDETDQVLAESNLLREVSAMLVLPSGIKDSLTLMLRAVRQLFNADYANIATIENDGRTHWRAMDGYRTEKYKELPYRRGVGTVARVVDTARTQHP